MHQADTLLGSLGAALAPYTPRRAFTARLVLDARVPLPATFHVRHKARASAELLILVAWTPLAPFASDTAFLLLCSVVSGRAVLRVCDLARAVVASLLRAFRPVAPVAHNTAGLVALGREKLLAAIGVVYFASAPTMTRVVAFGPLRPIAWVAARFALSAVVLRQAQLHRAQISTLARGCRVFTLPSSGERPIVS